MPSKNTKQKDKERRKKKKGRRDKKLAVKKAQLESLLASNTSNDEKKSEYDSEIKAFFQCFGITEDSRKEPPHSVPITDLRVFIYRTEDDSESDKEITETYRQHPEATVDAALDCEDEQIADMINIIKKDLSVIQDRFKSHDMPDIKKKVDIKREVNYRVALTILYCNFCLVFADQTEAKAYLTASLDQLAMLCSIDDSFSKLHEKHRTAFIYFIIVIFIIVGEEQEKGNIREDDSTVKDVVTALFSNKKNFPLLQQAVGKQLKYSGILKGLEDLATSYIYFSIKAIVDTQENEYQQKEVCCILNLTECCLFLSKILVGMQEQKLITWDDETKYKSYSLYPFLYSFLSICELCHLLISFHGNKERIIGMEPDLDWGELLSKAEKLCQYSQDILKYIGQCELKDAEDLFYIIFPEDDVIVPDSNCESLKENCIQLLKEKQNAINFLIQEAKEIEEIHKIRKREFITSLEKKDENRRLKGRRNLLSTKELIRKAQPKKRSISKKRKVYLLEKKIRGHVSDAPATSPTTSDNGDSEAQYEQKHPVVQPTTITPIFQRVIKLML